jgi:uncharacterized protein (TIGR02246 family)
MLRKILTLVCCVVGAGIGSARTLSAQTSSALAPAGTAADEKAVREVVQRYVDAREGRDAAALATLFTADADQFTTSGEWRKGRDAVVKGGLASSQRSPGTRTIKVETVRFVAPGVAIADGAYTITGGAEGQTRPMWTTIVATRGAEGWRIAAIRNALPATR